MIVQDAYHPTATSKFAHVLLPAAQWSEKGGDDEFGMPCDLYAETGRTARRSAAGLANHRRFAAAMGFGNAFAYQSAKEIFAEYAGLTESRICDCSGMTYRS